MFLSAFGASKPLIPPAPNYAGVNFTVRSSFVGITSASGSSAFGLGKFVAVDPDLCASSVDGVSWATASNTNAVRQITFNGTQFIGVSDSPSILSSVDGTSWSVLNSTPYFPADGEAFAFVSGVYCYVIGGSGYIAYSSDLINWSYVSVHSGAIKSIIIESNRFVAMCFDGTIYSSFDGVNWIYNTRVYNSGTGDAGQVYVSSSNLTICAGNNILQTKTPSTSFVSRTPPAAASFPLFGRFINSVFVLFYANAEIWTSTNGISWTQKVVSQGTNYAQVISNGSTLLTAFSNNAPLIVTSP